MKKIIALLLVLSMTGCSVMQAISDSPAGDTRVFAACKAADVITTGYALSTGRFVEKNALLAPIISQGMGPLIFISIAMVILLDALNNRDAVVAANAITCPVAVHNTWLLVK